MKYAIVGSGNIGTALARIFARNDIEVAVANSRGPESLGALVNELGSNVAAQSVEDASHADIVFLAVPFPVYKAVASQRKNWEGTILVDATNAFEVSPQELGDSLSSEVIANAFAGARVVKGFNHLPAAQLGAKPQQAIFLSTNDTQAGATVSDLAKELGFAPVDLGRLEQGGVPLHVTNGRPGGLLMQDLIKVN